MCKSFPHQVWQTIGSSLGSPLPHAVGNHHPDSFIPAANDPQLACRYALVPENPLSRALAARPSHASLRGAVRPECPQTGRPMHRKEPAQTVKCVKNYTNASFVYVRSTL